MGVTYLMATYNKTKKIISSCLVCNKFFTSTQYLKSINKGKYCSKTCCDFDKIGKKQSQESIKKRSASNIGKHKMSESHKLKIIVSNTGKVLSEETKDKIREKRKFQVNTVKGKTWKVRDTSNMIGKHSGEKNGRWIKDRTLLAKKQQRSDSAYKDWRMQVWKRDKFKCRISNLDCCGRIEAHHILSWSEYENLRYEVNNGITLCHAHHPRVRAEEKRLVPTFQELVSVSSKIL